MPKKKSSTELVPVEVRHVNGSQLQCVDARKLHTFLEVPTQFSTWMQRRIDEYDFLQDIDFFVSIFESGPIKTVEYSITMDMAKEIAMVERTQKGKQARRYFIEVEKAFTQQQQRSRTRKPHLLTSTEVILEKAKIALLQAQHDVALAQIDVWNARIAVAEEKIAQAKIAAFSPIILELPSPPPQLSVIQYLDKHKKPPLSPYEEQVLGKYAANLSRELGRSIGQAPDRRWKNKDGSWKHINAYDEDILEQSYNELHPKMT